MNENNSHDQLTVPQPMMTTLMWVGVVVLFVSFCLSLELFGTVRGHMKDFRDFGVLVGGGLAALLGIISIKVSFNPMAPQHKSVRLVISVVLLLGGVYRILYGIGLMD